jgi:hypothetical protein
MGLAPPAALKSERALACPMRILVTGASGLIGGAILGDLLYDKHIVIATSRNPSQHKFPVGVLPLAWNGVDALQVPGGCDAIVNLGGARVIGDRWTPQRMEDIRQSRIAMTQGLAQYVAQRPEGQRPRVLVSASAAGYYGVRPEGPCPEDRPPGDDFLATLCRDWEMEAQKAPCRVVALRFGHVLSRRGGYLGQLLPFARLCAAGPIGGGRQPMPWVHIHDVAAAIQWAIGNPAARGAYNVASPGAAGMDQRTFCRTVGKALHRPLQMPVPRLALRLRFGRGVGPVLLGGQDLRPVRLLDEGFAFRHAQLSPALAELLS